MAVRDVTSNSRLRLNAVTNGVTNDIFHGENIYLNEGKMAFMPISLETVMQPAYLHDPFTTEQNIAR